jgi:antitoxin (DNA-binding transcriptional repressor) of toxin-antitoxin stability system
MKETTISLGDAARDLSDCIDRAHDQNTALILLKDGKPVARITPERRCTAGELAQALARHPLSAEEAEAWLADLEQNPCK